MFPGLSPLNADWFNLKNASRFRTRRSSSYDRRGGNIDFIALPAGASVKMLEVEGPGIVNHLWFALGGVDYNYMRNLVIRAWWDGETNPSIQCPLGDLLGVGHAITNRYQFALGGMVRGSGKRGEYSGGNLFLPMPFAQSARIEVTNEGPAFFTAFYFAVDWLQADHDAVADAGRLHIQWRRDNPVAAKPVVEANVFLQGRFGANLDGRHNYVVADIEGEGRFLGLNYSLDNLDPRPLGNVLQPFGEGDEMVFIDDDTWPPSLHGTGTEDAFLDAWGMTGDANLYAGVAYERLHTPEQRGRGTCYRWHLHDPIYFSKRLRYTFEHGHDNCQANDITSTAYWYQREPHRPFELPPASARLPHPIENDPDRAQEVAAVQAMGQVLQRMYGQFMTAPRKVVEQVDFQEVNEVNECRTSFAAGAMTLAQLQTRMAKLHEKLDAAER